MEKESDSLAKKPAMASSSFTPRVQKYVEALRSTCFATEHTQLAQGLMQRVHALGRMPKKRHDPKECHLARKLRDARVVGLMVHGSRFMAHAPRLVDQGSWPTPQAYESKFSIFKVVKFPSDCLCRSAFASQHFQSPPTCLGS